MMLVWAVIMLSVLAYVLLRLGKRTSEFGSHRQRFMEMSPAERQIAIGNMWAQARNTMKPTRYVTPDWRSMRESCERQERIIRALTGYFSEYELWERLHQEPTDPTAGGELNRTIANTIAARLRGSKKCEIASTVVILHRTRPKYDSRIKVFIDGDCHGFDVSVPSYGFELRITSSYPVPENAVVAPWDDLLVHLCKIDRLIIKSRNLKSRPMAVELRNGRHPALRVVILDKGTLMATIPSVLTVHGRSWDLQHQSGAMKATSVAELTGKIREWKLQLPKNYHSDWTEFSWTDRWGTDIVRNLRLNVDAAVVAQEIWSDF
jgi:hypothetical protein